MSHQSVECGEFVAAGPDRPIAEPAVRRLRPTVAISTKLNRGHLVYSQQALILQCLARSDIDVQKIGRQAIALARPAALSACGVATEAMACGGGVMGRGLDRMRSIDSFLWATELTTRSVIQQSGPADDSCHS
jgi:hypothetical protein